MALIQAITIEDHRYAQALRAVDFIKRHVFPGSFIPSISAMLGAAARNSDLKLFQLEDIGPSYALTLAAWRERFHQRLPEVRALGYDERFVRMWDFYLAYCEGGFRERSIGVVQMLLAKPGCRREQFLPDWRPAHELDQHDPLPGDMDCSRRRRRTWTVVGRASLMLPVFAAWQLSVSAWRRADACLLVVASLRSASCSIPHLYNAA